MILIVFEELEYLRVIEQSIVYKEETEKNVNTQREFGDFMFILNIFTDFSDVENNS